jgi:hypothetical protein
MQKMFIGSFYLSRNYVSRNIFRNGFSRCEIKLLARMTLSESYLFFKVF